MPEYLDYECTGMQTKKLMISQPPRYMCYVDKSNINLGIFIIPIPLGLSHSHSHTYILCARACVHVPLHILSFIALSCQAISGKCVIVKVTERYASIDMIKSSHGPVQMWTLCSANTEFWLSKEPTPESGLEKNGFQRMGLFG